MVKIVNNLCPNLGAQHKTSRVMFYMAATIAVVFYLALITNIIDECYPVAILDAVMCLFFFRESWWAGIGREKEIARTMPLITNMERLENDMLWSMLKCISNRADELEIELHPFLSSAELNDAREMHLVCRSFNSNVNTQLSMTEISDILKQVTDALLKIECAETVTTFHESIREANQAAEPLRKGADIV